MKQKRLCIMILKKNKQTNLNRNILSNDTTGNGFLKKQWW